MLPCTIFKNYESGSPDGSDEGATNKMSVDKPMRPSGVTLDCIIDYLLELGADGLLSTEEERNEAIEELNHYPTTEKDVYVCLIPSTCKYYLGGSKKGKGRGAKKASEPKYLCGAPN